MGDGTDESHSRIQESLDSLWKYTNEIFYKDDIDSILENESIVPSSEEIKVEWSKTVNDVLMEATLEKPSNNWVQEGGRKGLHTESLGYLLAEMQYMQRAYPNMTW